MQTSAAGIAFKKRQEGDVLRAYRCPAGHWTIGPGLTAASGVVTPRAGMVITPEESTRLTALALQRNYEPRVNRAMPGARQHEFDAGISFDWNTGAIHRASWVPAWRAGNRDETRRRLALWNKGGGKVLPGLVARREAEFRLLAHGDYGLAVNPSRGAGLARHAIEIDADMLAAIRDALDGLGYEIGHDARGVGIEAVRAFQRAHDLTVDGVIGRATLSTLQRVIDSRRKALTAAAPTAAGAVETGGEGVAAATDLPGADLFGPALLILGAIWLAWLAYQYRDTIAAAVHPYLPRAAAWLRSW